MIQDALNGCLEFVGSIFIWMSIARLNKDRDVKGIVWYHPAFFVCWGMYNLYYYPHLDQWFSFAGGVSIAVANCIWVSQMIYWSRKSPGELNG